MSGGSLADQIAKLKSSGVPADKIDEYKAAFALFDTDGSGVISEAPRRHARSARCARFQAHWSPRDRFARAPAAAQMRASSLRC